MTSMTMTAMSVADDLSFVALHDVASVMAELDRPYRIIGGHMVSALAARHDLGASLYRETGDTDLGVPPIALHDDEIIRRLESVGYAAMAGNRFGKPITDVPVILADGQKPEHLRAIVDILVPAYTRRARQNQAFGTKLVTTEVLGLGAALRRPPVTLDVAMTRLNGQTLPAQLDIADEVSALVLKCHVTRRRDKDTDLIDLWRCLEICYAAGVGPDSFEVPDELLLCRGIVEDLFADRGGVGIARLTTAQMLSSEGADTRHTRIRALAATVLG